MNELSDKQCKRLTELIGECWDADKHPGGDLPNRTFSTPDDTVAVMEALVKQGKWEEFYYWAEWKWVQEVESENTVEAKYLSARFNAWLMRPTDEQGKPHFCRLVAEWMKSNPAS